MHLDRVLPFDPIPLLRSPVTSADKKGEIAGWGGSKALTADITEVEGAGIKRSAKVKILGHADRGGLPRRRSQPRHPRPRDPRQPAQDRRHEAVGQHLRRRFGRTAADRGAWPRLTSRASASGPACSARTTRSSRRIDPFLAYFDDAVARAGKAPIIPRLECVEDLGGGSFNAQFGYRNDNALTVNIPYGSKNAFPKDSANARPTAFRPGDYPFDFSVPFTSGQTLSWKLVPPGGPSTVVQASAASPVCDPNNQTFVCAKSCDNSLAAECADPFASRPDCINSCLANTVFFTEYVPCGAEWNAYLGCVTNVPPPAENWGCSPGSVPFPQSPNCDAEVGAIYTCLGY